MPKAKVTSFHERAYSARSYKYLAICVTSLGGVVDQRKRVGLNDLLGAPPRNMLVPCFSLKDSLSKEVLSIIIETLPPLGQYVRHCRLLLCE